jgi:hypothetical protein
MRSSLFRMIEGLPYGGKIGSQAARLGLRYLLVAVRELIQCRDTGLSVRRALPNALIFVRPTSQTPPWAPSSIGRALTLNSRMKARHFGC